jgi:hypothetical protein
LPQLLEVFMRLLLPTSSLAAAACGTAAVALLAGCPDRSISEVTPQQDKAELKEVPVQLNRNVDILFVIDNSSSMAEEQGNLITNFPRFIEVLQSIKGGLPDVHIGVVSSDMGAGSPGDSTCKGDGDGGKLRLGVKTSGGADACAGLITNSNERFLSDVQDPSDPTGSKRLTNYTGSLSEAFQCIARLGDKGCGFEHQLESMRRALDPQNNPGFLRDDAFLAVVFLTDEDDCSSKDPNALFTTNTGVLGARVSFRCFEYGVKCTEGGRGFGARTNCDSAEDSPYFFTVDEYVQFLKELKGPGKEKLVITAGIIGVDVKTLEPAPVKVGPDTDNASRPELLPVCSTKGAGSAAPGVRLSRFFRQFPDRNTVTTICNENLSDAMVLIGELLKKALGNPCIEGKLKEPYDCSVSDVVNSGTPQQTETIVPACATNGNKPPCWEIVADPVACSKAPSLKMEVKRSGTVPAGTVERTQCVVENQTPAP